MSLRRDRYKLIGYRGYEQSGPAHYELYDLVADPEERENLFSPGHSVATDLQQELDAKLRLMDQPFSHV